MKKNGFIATSILYAFFLVFITLFIGLVTAYAHNKAAVLRINEKVREELKGIRSKTLADMKVGDYVKFDIKEDQKTFLNPEGKWIVAVKEVADNGDVDLTLISDRETPSRYYVLPYGQEISENDYSTFHRGIEGMEKAIRYKNQMPTPTHLDDALYINNVGGKKTSINIDFFTVDTFKKIKESDVDDYIKDNIINVGSDYVLKNTVREPINVQAANIYYQCFLNPTSADYLQNQWNNKVVNGVTYTCNNPYNDEMARRCNAISNQTKPGYYRLRLYNFGANIDNQELLQRPRKNAAGNIVGYVNTRYYYAANKLGYNNEAAKLKYANQMFYATYCGPKNYSDYLNSLDKTAANPPKYPLSYMSTTYDNERGVEYIDFCYNAIPYPYVHDEEEHVIVSNLDYQRCNLETGAYSDYIIGFEQSSQSTYTEQNIRLQMQIHVPNDGTNSNGEYLYLRDYILAGNGASDNIYIYTDGVKK